MPAVLRLVHSSGVLLCRFLPSGARPPALWFSLAGGMGLSRSGMTMAIPCGTSLLASGESLPGNPCQSVLFRRGATCRAGYMDRTRSVSRRAAPGASFPVPEGYFQPAYHHCGKGVHIQTAAGRRWLLDYRSGHLLYDAPASANPWPAPPVSLGPHHFILVPDPRHARPRRWQYGTKHLWTFVVNAPSAIPNQRPPRSRLSQHDRCCDSDKPRHPLATDRFGNGKTSVG